MYSLILADSRKYVCKYIGKIDEQINVVLYVEGIVQIVKKYVLLHNNKMSTNKFNEDKLKTNRIYKANIRGIIISHTKIIQNMLNYLVKFPT